MEKERIWGRGEVREIGRGRGRRSAVGMQCRREELNLKKIFCLHCISGLVERTDPFLLWCLRSRRELLVGDVRLHTKLSKPGNKKLCSAVG